jgi:hypothetical protein
VLNSYSSLEGDEGGSETADEAWSATQTNFNVGVCGSLHEKSFKAALATLGVTSKRSQEVTRKATATVRRTLEVHDLMLKSTIGRVMGTLTGVPLDWQARPLQIRPRDAASLSTICTQLKGRLPVLPTLTDLRLLPSLVAYRSQQFFGDPRS